MVAVVAAVLVPSELSENTLTVYGSVFTAVIKKKGGETDTIQSYSHERT